MWVLPSFCNHAYLSFLHLLSSILAGSYYHRQNPPAKNTKHHFFNLQNQKFLFLLLILMKLIFKFIFIILFFNHGISDSEIRVKYHLLLQVPLEYEVGFTGRAFLMETDQITPNFRVALSVEAINGKYSCSLEVFLGDVRVWNSGHYSRFYTTEKCMLELTDDGDLRLNGPKEQIGWKTGTSGQAVEVKIIWHRQQFVLLPSDFIVSESLHFGSIESNTMLCWLKCFRICTMWLYSWIDS